MDSLFLASEKLCRTHATSFYFASQFLPEPKQQEAYALYGFCRHADNAVDNHFTLEKKQNDLNTIREELKHAWENPSRKISDDPSIIDAFVHVCHTQHISPNWGFSLLDGLQLDLEKKSYASFDEVYHYCYHVAGVPGILLAHIAGVPNHAYGYAESLGIGMQLTNMIRDIKEDAGLGRIYFPTDEQREFGITSAHFQNGILDNAMHDFLTFQVQRAQKYYQESQKGFTFIHPEYRLPLKLCHSFYQEILHEIVKRDYDVFSSRVIVSHKKKLELLQQEIKNNPPVSSVFPLDGLA